jgi:hypothetical protein
MGSNYFRLKNLMTKLMLVAATVFVVNVNAETTSHMDSTKDAKGLTLSGYAEAGYARSWTSPATGGGAMDSEFLLDSANIRMNWDVTDRVFFVLDSAFSARPPVSVTDGNSNGVGVGNLYNTSNYYAKTFLSNANSPYAAGSLIYALNEAYVANKWCDGFNMWVGQYKTPFGMESRVSRFDMPTYYYSMAYNNANNFNMFYDIGVKLDFVGESWGHLELSVTDGKSVLTPQAAGNTYSPSVAARYSYEYKNGDMSLTPVISAYLGEWSGGPQDVGLSAGLAYKMGVFNVNAEWVMSAMDSNPISDTQDSKIWSVYVEPGFDLGMLQVNVKGEYYNSSGTNNYNDWNIGASIGHTYQEKYRIRLAYEAVNLSGNSPSGHINDIRLLFGTKF